MTPEEAKVWLEHRAEIYDNAHRKKCLVYGDNVAGEFRTLKGWIDAIASQARREALEEAIAACRKQQEGFLSPEYATNQPFSSHGERFGCGSCITAIRALMERED